MFALCFGFVFCFVWWFRDGLLDYVQVLYQFSLEAPQSADGLVYALISQLTLFCNMQLNVLNDLAEAMKALDGKKLYWMLFCLRMMTHVSQVASSYVLTQPC